MHEHAAELLPIVVYLLSAVFASLLSVLIWLAKGILARLSAIEHSLSQIQIAWTNKLAHLSERVARVEASRPHTQD